MRFEYAAVNCQYESGKLVLNAGPQRACNDVVLIQKVQLLTIINSDKFIIHSLPLSPKNTVSNMVTKRITSKSATKNIRIPHRLIEQINQALKEECSDNFTAWVVDACWRKLKQKQEQSKE